MALRVLLLDDATRKKVQGIVEFASRPENLYKAGPDAKIPGDDPSYTTWLNDFRCVFTWTAIENRVFKHLSVSVDHSQTALPHPVMVQEIARLFGFTGELTDWMVNVAHEPVLCLVMLQEVKG